MNLKKVLIVLLVFLMFITSCNSSPISLDNPSYDEFSFWGEQPPEVYQNQDFAVITALNTFFVYDKKEEKITKAYGIKTDESFAPGYFTRPIFDIKNNKVIISAYKDLSTFNEYHFIYNIKDDSFQKIDGNSKIDYEFKHGEEQAPIEFDGDAIMSDDLNIVYFLDKDKKNKIYPFKTNFKKEDFVIK